ncbi:hypothetical protein [Streptomyces boninensis]|uniref:hypothetical protein n=1 Tax=Streptomyces boninensis TaxID=2039455 RepID=UPI003B20F5DD
MMGRIATVAAVAAAAGLLLAGCGGDDGGDGKASGEIKGAGKSSTPSKSESVAPGAPEFDLPSDVKVEVSADETGDKAKDAVLKDHEYALMASQESFAKAEPTANFKRFWTGQAAAQYEASFKAYKKDGATVTGSDRFYFREVTSLKGKRATVAFCEDQSKFFDKIVKSGKVERNKPSLKSFVDRRVVLEKSGDGHWRVVEAQGSRGSKECQQKA